MRSQTEELQKCKEPKTPQVGWIFPDVKCVTSAQVHDLSAAHRKWFQSNAKNEIKTF